MRTSWGLCLCWAAILCILAPYLYACAFLYPRGDDFDAATRAMFFLDLPGGLYEAGREWLSWSGRYAYHFLAVFVGRAAESPALYGAVCAAVIGVHSWAFYLLAGSGGAARGAAALFAGFATAGMLSWRQGLPDFYLLTDALTIVLQEAAFVLFFACLCRLEAADAAAQKKRARLCLLAGIAAIGLYEHAALAVFFTAGAYLLFCMIRRPAPLRKLSGKLCLGLGLALLCSFCAPGNFARKALRPLSAEQAAAQLGSWPGDWLQALSSFAASDWLPGILCLGLMAALLFPAKRFSPLRCLLALAAFGAFSLALALAQALSDAPLSSSPKFAASLGFYAALAAGFCIRNAAATLGGIKALWPALVLCFICAIGASANFGRVAANAVNGDIWLLGRFMAIRNAFLAEAARANPNRPPAMGLAGEIANPGLRARKPAAADPVEVRSLPAPVFPVYVGEALSARAAAWPNMWAAWMYGVEGIAATAPEPGPAIADRFEGLELALPPELKAAGLKSAWRLNAPGRNSTFACDWLVLEAAALPPRIFILRPAPLAWQRFAPLPLQAWLLAALLRKDRLERNDPAGLAGSFLDLPGGSPAPGGLYAIPLGIASPENPWPPAVFLSLDGKTYCRLNPFM